MAPKMDVYALCPCGSGKKIKFCCQDALKEMDRIARLHEGRQTDKALEVLDELAAEYPSAPILPITRAQLLMEEERFDEAASAMRDFLRENENNANGTGLYALARFMDVGFHEARPDIHRAFQVCAQSSPDIVASLASQIAEDVLQSNSMAAREHLALALRLTRDPQERQTLFQRLMQIDGAQEIPYPMRGAHQLEPVESTEETEKDLKTALRLTMMGCWEIAAKLYARAAEQLGDNWAVWKNIALCRVWDTDHDGAAEAFHKAAELAPNFDDGVECETLAQLLDLPVVEEQVDIIATRFKLKSTGKVLTMLDEAPRFHRLVDRQAEPNQNPRVVARYLVLDREEPGEDEEVTEENVPVVLSEISVFEITMPDATQSVLSVMAPDSDDREAGVDLLESLIKDEIEPPEEGEGEKGGRMENPVRQILKELVPSQNRKYYGLRVDVNHRREIAKADARVFVGETWVNMPLNRLEGKTPKEASAEDGLKAKVAAAVHVLEAVSDQAVLFVDLNEVRSSLGLPEAAPVEITEETSMNALTSMQLSRLSLSALSDEQLAQIVKRAMLTHHVPFVYDVLTEVASRGVEKVRGLDKPTFIRSFAQTCQEMGRRDEALKWIQAGRQNAEDEDEFEEKLNWVMREFQFRIEDRKDPELPGLVEHIWNYYGGKIPQIRDAMRPVLDELEIPIPGETAGGLVLPESATAAASSGGESKLWLPGQS
jgi:tetratricopeptide (TPR) repeat protein